MDFDFNGYFLLLTGLPLSGSSVTTSTYQTTYPYLGLGLPLIFLGISMIVISAIPTTNHSLKQMAIGLSGQILFGLVIFVIPLMPSFAFMHQFNFQTYSIVLGSVGIILSLESIATLSKIGSQTHAIPHP